MRNIALFIGCAILASGFAAVRVPGPIKIVDADGDRSYEYVEIHDIVGEIGGIVIIGAVGGNQESRGYVGSAFPKWIEAGTNAVTRPYTILKRNRYELNHRHGINLAMIAISDTNKILVVAKDSKDNQLQGNIGDVSGKELYHHIMVDATSGLEYRGCCGDEFDDGSGDSALFSFYFNSNGLIKVWYEVVDAQGAVLAKGWFRGRLDGHSVVDRDEATIYGGEAVEILPTPIPVKNTLERFACNDIAWLHVAARRKNAVATAGIMVKRE